MSGTGGGPGGGLYISSCCCGVQPGGGPGGGLYILMFFDCKSNVSLKTKRSHEKVDNE